MEFLNEFLLSDLVNMVNDYVDPEIEQCEFRHRRMMIYTLDIIGRIGEFNQASVDYAIYQERSDEYVNNMRYPCASDNLITAAEFVEDDIQEYQEPERWLERQRLNRMTRWLPYTLHADKLDHSCHMTATFDEITDLGQEYEDNQDELEYYGY